MARAASDITSARETEAQAAELAALLRLLDISAGTSSLNIAVCNSPALRDYLIGRVRESRSDLSVVALPRGCVDVYGEVVNTVAATKPGAVFVTCIEHSVSSESKEHPTLKSLNASRDLWESRFPCPVVFWVPAYVAALLPVHAPDLWRYRSHGFEFVAPTWTQEHLLQLDATDELGVSANLDAVQKNIRIAELEQRIDNADWPPSMSIFPHLLKWMQELAFLYQWTGDSIEAEAILHKALAICTEIGYAKGIADVIEKLSIVAELRGDYEEVERLTTEELKIHRGDSGYEASRLGRLGFVAVSRGDLDSAEKCFRDALEIERRIGRAEGEAEQLANLGEIAHKRGDLDIAEAHFREALRIDRNLARHRAMASRLGKLGMIARERGDLDAAEQHFSDSLSIERSRGTLEGIAIDLGQLGNIALERGDLDTAERLHRESLQMFREGGWVEGESPELGQLGIIAWMRGDLDAADRLFRESLEIERRLKRPDRQASRISGLGGIAEARSDLELAKRFYDDALAMCRTLGNSGGQAEQLIRLGNIAQKQGDFVAAREHWIEACELLKRNGTITRAKTLQRDLDSLP